MTDAHPEGVLEPAACPKCNGSGFDGNLDQRATCRACSGTGRHSRASPLPADREADRKMVLDAIAASYCDAGRAGPLPDHYVFAKEDLDDILELPPAAKAALSRLMVG